MKYTKKQIRLANILHNLRCHRSHTDQCGWFYEEDWYKDQKQSLFDGHTDIWLEPSHIYWMNEAKRLSKYFTNETLSEIEHASWIKEWFIKRIYELDGKM